VRSPALLRRLADAMDAAGVPDDGKAALAATRALLAADSTDPRLAVEAIDSRFLAQRQITKVQMTEVLAGALIDVAALTRDRPPLIAIDEIDSFAGVRDVPQSTVVGLSYPLNIAEDHVKAAIHAILSEPFATPHSPAELSDINTSVIVDGRQIGAAFLLKGPGLRKPIMQVKDLGSQGNQIVKLARSEADLLVVQFVGQIAEDVIVHLRQAVNDLRLSGRPAIGSVWDGTTTARLLLAQGWLDRSNGSYTGPTTIGG
jgi:hypothetical protein